MPKVGDILSGLKKKTKDEKAKAGLLTGALVLGSGGSVGDALGAALVMPHEMRKVRQDRAARQLQMDMAQQEQEREALRLQQDFLLQSGELDLLERDLDFRQKQAEQTLNMRNQQAQQEQPATTQSELMGAFEGLNPAQESAISGNIPLSAADQLAVSSLLNFVSGPQGFQAEDIKLAFGAIRTKIMNKEALTPEEAELVIAANRRYRAAVAKRQQPALPKPTTDLGDLAKMLDVYEGLQMTGDPNDPIIQNLGTYVNSQLRGLLPEQQTSVRNRARLEQFKALSKKDQKEMLDRDRQTTEQMPPGPERTQREQLLKQAQAIYDNN